MPPNGTTEAQDPEKQSGNWGPNVGPTALGKAPPSLQQEGAGEAWMEAATKPETLSDQEFQGVGHTATTPPACLSTSTLLHSQEALY